nr:MAG TPA: HNH endonuclease [Caudoviricetes sp.]
MSFEVDEVVPVSRGGSPIDRANVQPAHRICNQRRGNRMPGDAGTAGLAVRRSRDW